MMDWTLIAGGRCPGQPWRVGIAGFAFKNQQVFLLSDEDWEHLATLAPLEPLIAYGKGNGLSFERIMPGDTPVLDGVLLFAPGWKGQPLVSLPEGVRRYIALTGAKLRSELADESLFAKLFLPIDLPPYGERLIYLNQHVLRDPACPPETWALEKEAHDKDYSRSYSRSADFWIQRITSAIASDAADQRGIRPLLSVVIPTYNHGRFLHQSVRSTLDQGVDDIEVVVLDNASIDETAEVMTSLVADQRVRYIRNRYNYGPGFNWGNGLQVASGRYIAFLSADDYFNPGHLTRLLSVLQARPDIAVGYSSITWVDGDGQPMNQPRHPGYRGCDYVGGRNEVAELLIYDNYMAPSAVVFDRQALRATWIPVSNGGAGDWDMVIQMAERYPNFAYINTPGVSYRWHGAQHSQQDFYTSVAPLADHLTIVEGVFQRGAHLQLKGYEREVAAHIARRLGQYPDELESALGDRARALIDRLENQAIEHETPLFSIVLTTYNRPRLLKDALASLAAQTLQDFEVVLVNDHGEPVETLLQSWDFPITYVYLGRNRGLSAARNAGLRLARGRHIAYLDDDDIYLPEHLANLAQGFVEHPQAVLYSAVEYVSEQLEDDRRIELSRSRPFLHDVFDADRLRVQNYIPVNTWAHPRGMLESVGEFDTRLTAFEDWDMLLRLAARYSFVHLPQVTSEVRVRESAGSAEHMLAREQKNFLPLYREIYRRYPASDNDAVCQQRQQLLQRLSSKPATFTLRDWLARRRPTEQQWQLIEKRLANQLSLPVFAILLRDLAGDGEKLARSLASLRGLATQGLLVKVVVLRQEALHEDGVDWLAVEAGDWCASVNRLLGDAAFDWFMLLDAGDELTESGLLLAALELLESPDCRAIYGDEVYRQVDGQLGAALRPDFNLDYLLSFPAGMARHWLFRREVVVQAGGLVPAYGDAAEFELILRLITSGGLAGLGHVAEPWLVTDMPVLRNSEAEQQAILEHLRARGYTQAQVVVRQPGRYCLRYGHDQQPGVSLLIATGSRLTSLQRCVETLMETTGYAHYEILLVETDAAAVEVRQWLQALESLGEARLRVLWAADKQGLAGALNHAAQQALGDYLLLLAAETAVIQADWLDELLNHGQRPEVGVVGGKLLAADGTVRHAGLILGLQGVAGRPFVGEPLDAAGYMQRLQVDQNYSAVSRDCLLVRRELYLSVAGMAEDVPECFLDVDLCLRVRQAGYLTVWAAQACLLLERESESLCTPVEQDALYARWLPLLAQDPAYNPNLSLQRAGGFALESNAWSWRPLQSWKPLPVVLAHPADRYGCGHYRVIQPFKALKQAGCIEGLLADGLPSVIELQRYAPDTIILQRQIGDERLDAMRRMQQFSSAFKVYELDDYLPNLPMKSAYRQAMPRDVLKSLRRGLSYVDRLVVSTPALAEALAGLHEDIRVVGNRLPVSWWAEVRPGQRGVSRKPRVGWAGGAGHTGDLEMIADVVRELAGEVEWVFMGMCPDSLRPYVHEFHPGVAIEQYPAALAGLNLDLALAPVEQNLFNDCKSNLRLLEYGACGVPVICSDVRCYREDGLPVMRVKNRFRDWVEAIRMHLADMEATARQGDELRDVVLRDWMLQGDALDAWLKAWRP